MILFFKDAVSLTGVQPVPQPMVLVYPTVYELEFTCMSGPNADVPVDIESLGCTEWTVSIRTGFGTSAETLTGNVLGAECVSGNRFTLPLDVHTMSVYKYVAGRRRSLVVFCIKGSKTDNGITSVHVAIQFPVVLQSASDNPEPPPPPTSYNALTDLPTLNSVAIKGSKTSKDYGLVSQVTSMPILAGGQVGNVYMYVGPDTEEYKHGHVYTASWDNETLYWEDIIKANYHPDLQYILLP